MQRSGLYLHFRLAGSRSVRIGEAGREGLEPYAIDQLLAITDLHTASGVTVACRDNNPMP